MIPRMKSKLKDEPAGAEAEVTLPPHVQGWGKPLLDVLAAGVDLPSVDEVWVQYPDGDIEGPLPGGRSSWRIINELDVVVLVRSGTPHAGASAPAVMPAPMPGPPTVLVPPVHAASSLAAATHAASCAGVELPTLSEEERNWKRIHALFLDEPCPVPRILQQVRLFDLLFLTLSAVIGAAIARTPVTASLNPMTCADQ